MPTCPALHRAKIGQFQPTLTQLLMKKVRRRKQGKYSPFCKWDYYTDLSYRLVLTTFCILVFLTIAQCTVLCFKHSDSITTTVHFYAGGCVSQSLFCDSFSSIGAVLTSDRYSAMDMLQWKHPSARQAGNACHSRYVNISTAMFLMLCGDIELNPGPLPEMEELINGLENRLEMNLGNKIDYFSAKVDRMSCQLNNISQKLKEGEQAMDDMKKRTAALENKMYQLDEEIEKQRIHSRRNHVIFYGVTETSGETGQDCARAVLYTINLHDDTGKEWQLDDLDRAYRLGQHSEQRSRPILVKLHNANDKRALIANRSTRQSLRSADVSMNDDLTPRQRTTLKELRDQGFTAYYRGTRLHKRPREHRGEQQERQARDSSPNTEATTSSHDFPSLPCRPPQSPAAPTTTSSVDALTSPQRGVDNRVNRQTPIYAGRGRGRGSPTTDISSDDSSGCGGGRGGGRRAQLDGGASSQPGGAGYTATADHPGVKTRSRLQTGSTAGTARGAGHGATGQRQGRIDTMLGGSKISD